LILTLPDGDEVEIPPSGAVFLRTWDLPPLGKDRPPQTLKPLAPRDPQPIAQAIKLLASDDPRLKDAVWRIVALIRRVSLQQTPSRKELESFRKTLQRALRCCREPKFALSFRDASCLSALEEPNRLAEALELRIAEVDRDLAIIPPKKGKYLRMDTRGPLFAKVLCAAAAIWLIALASGRWRGRKSSHVRLLSGVLWAAATGSKLTGAHVWDWSIDLLLQDERVVPETDVAHADIVSQNVAAGMSLAMRALELLRAKLRQARFAKSELIWKKHS
jgi:hypothetical protein